MQSLRAFSHEADRSLAQERYEARMPKRVSVAEAEELVREGYVLVDVRSVVEFEAGHPKGAFNVPVAFIEARGQVLNEALLIKLESKIFCS